MRPLQNHDRRRRDPRQEDNSDRALARQERPPGFGRGRLRASDADLRLVRDRRCVGGADDNRVRPCVLILPLAQSRHRFGLSLVAPRFPDRRGSFRLRQPGGGDEPCERAFLTLTAIPRNAGAILRLGLGALRLHDQRRDFHLSWTDEGGEPCARAPFGRSRPSEGLSAASSGLASALPDFHARRHGFRLPRTGEGDELCERPVVALAPIRTAAGPILRLGDKRRRRFSEHRVTATLMQRPRVGARLFWKPHRSLIKPDSLPVETGTYFALGCCQSDMRGHGQLLRHQSSSLDDRGPPRERPT